MNRKKKFPLIAKVTRVHRVGGSLMITLPAEFVKAHTIAEGDDVGILANHVLKLDPMKEGQFEEEEAPITVTATVKLKGDVLIPDEELLLPYPDRKNVDTDDEKRLAIGAYAQNYEQIRDYVEQRKPAWKRVRLTFETITKARQKFFKVVRITEGEENTAPPGQK